MLRPFQFSLAALLVVMTGAGVGLWAAMSVYRSMENLTLDWTTANCLAALCGLVAIGIVLFAFRR